MNKAKKILSILLCFLIVCSAFLSAMNTAAVYNVKGYITGNDVNIRTGAGTSNASLGRLAKNTPVFVKGEDYAANGALWYQLTAYTSSGDIEGYVHSDYVHLTPEYTEDVDFEAYLKAQGFPESYKEKLRQLHTLYPKWIFVSDEIDMTWDQAVAGETAQGRSLVSGSASAAWKSLKSQDYDWDSKTWTVYDSGGWVAAADNVVKYYLDPRNFLTSTGIFQFISMKYDPVLNTKESLQSALDGTFMEDAFPEDTYDTYADVLMAAAEQSGVSPIALASMILIEQGSNGTGSSISGTVNGYTGYYNYFNIRAYAYGGYSAVQYGLLYAKGGDGTAASYYRPWNTRAKSILGGAKYYADGYISRGQSTLYYKKFNVVSTPYFSHQYMTNIQAAASEAGETYNGYKEILNSSLVFNIPVYKNMPEEIMPYPTSSGNNDCYLSDISLNGYSFTPTFNRYTNKYEVIVPSTVSSIVVTPVKSNSESAVTGGGAVSLGYGTNDINITVTSSSGLKNTYTVSVFREGSGGSVITDPVPEGKVYKVETNKIIGIKPSTSKEVFVTNLAVKGGTAQIKDSTHTLVRTGDIVEILDNSGAVRYTYTAVVECDINRDGRFSLVDIAAFQRHLVDIQAITNEASVEAADLNGDGKISLVDISRMQRKYLGIDP